MARRRPSKPSKGVQSRQGAVGKAAGRRRVAKPKTVSKRPTKPAGASKRATRRTLGPKAPLWTLEQGFTQSAITLWESCHEQFGLKFVDGWTPKALVHL